MEGVQSKESQDPTLTNTRGGKYLMVAQALLRTLVAVCTLTAACLMFTSKQTTSVFGVSFSAKYNYVPAFRFSAEIVGFDPYVLMFFFGGGFICRFFADANVAACVLSLLSLGTVCFIYHRLTYFFLFLHDLVMMTLLMAACAASTAIGEVGAHGNSYTGWMPICDHFGKFCNRVTASLIFSYLAVMMFLVLTVLSALRMQPPRLISSSSSVVVVV
ncbi:CASP-like protein 1F1 [Telopea speciosissima]|uniref:CASP-like protein 1F1 n=1 Tax=Telopea speciosissima TaxID=54955 RepID=UPI001CC7FA1D|nr:CASP-like protein 1F1 [Telopea speciosissima]